MNRLLCSGVVAAAALLPSAEAMAHGFAGDRFFPATILTDDPFVASEMSLPTFTLNPTQSDGSREFDLGSDLSMLITPNWDFTLSSQWEHIKPLGMPAITGWGGLTTGTQYQLFINAPHEAMALAALDVTWQNTGNLNVGAPDFTTLSPTFDFGKGFGDLPDFAAVAAPVRADREYRRELSDADRNHGYPKPEQRILRLCDRI